MRWRRDETGSVCRDLCCFGDGGCTLQMLRSCTPIFVWPAAAAWICAARLDSAVSWPTPNGHFYSGSDKWAHDSRYRSRRSSCARSSGRGGVARRITYQSRTEGRKRSGQKQDGDCNTTVARRATSERKAQWIRECEKWDAADLHISKWSMAALGTPPFQSTPATLAYIQIYIHIHTHRLHIHRATYTGCNCYISRSHPSTQPY